MKEKKWYYLRYCLYILGWYLFHFGKCYKGMTPSSFYEWLDNDFRRLENVK